MCPTEQTDPIGTPKQANSIATGLSCAFVPSHLTGTSDDDLNSSRILIFEYKDCVQAMRTELLKSGFSSVSITNQQSVLNSVVTDRSADLILIDSQSLREPKIRAAISACTAEPRIPILAIASGDDTACKKLAVEVGVDDFLSTPVDHHEVVVRTRNTLRSSITTKKLAEFTAQLQNDILIDPTTNIANRRAFDFELSRKMIEWQRQRCPLALVMIDIDFFKRVNDRFGHQAGDYALAQVAGKIKDSMREMDLVCRFGGEEFAVIIPIKRPGEATQTAERIRQKLEETTFRFEDSELQITVSIGVAEAMKGDDQELIVKRADTALYYSKQNGRNQVTFHDGAKCISVKHSGCGERATIPTVPQENQFSLAVNDDNFNLCSSNILVVDDSRATTRIVRSYLNKGGFRNLLCETDSTKVMSYFENRAPDLVLMDVSMPEIDGLTLLSKIRSEERTREIPVVILTSNTDHETKRSALDLGANDFLHKPVICSELIARVTNTLLANAHTRFLAGYSMRLEHELKLRTADLIASRREAIQCLARAAELHSDSSGRHIVRVGKYAAIIAEELGFTDSQVIEMEHAAQLHDVGNIGLPEAILKKADQLTNEEFELVKEHCNQGGVIIRDDGERQDATEKPCLFLLDSCSSSVMRMAALVAESHHEKWDGTGYPSGSKGENIPIEGRIAAVCDVFDSISNSKCYREAFDLDTCFQIIADSSGTHFDPEIVDAFFARKADVVQVYHDFGTLE